MTRRPLTLRIYPGSAVQCVPWCDHCGWVEFSHACHVTEMSPDDEFAALAELNAICADHPAVVAFEAAYCGVMEWRTPNGWLLQVFNDCGEWDYVQRIIASDGREWDYPFESSGLAMTERIADWTPAPANYGGWPKIECCPP